MKVLSCHLKLGVGEAPAGQLLSVACPKKNPIQIVLLFFIFLKKMQIKCRFSPDSYGVFGGRLDCDTTRSYGETLTDYELTTVIIQSFILFILCLSFLTFLCSKRNK